MIEPSIPIAALEHAAYCRRQWALIHVDRYFADNDDTVKGHIAHERVDEEGSTLRSAIRTERRLPVWSDELGLHGYCDVVEFDGDEVRPIEYKSGKRAVDAAKVQVAAQAMCLEEMLSVSIGAGAIYLVGSNKMVPVEIDGSLRQEVRSLADELRERLEERALPAPANDRRCDGCSLSQNCLPEIVSDRRKVGTLFATTWHA